MKKVKITVMKTACYKDLIEKYENPDFARLRYEGRTNIYRQRLEQAAKIFATAPGKAYPLL